MGSPTRQSHGSRAGSARTERHTSPRGRSRGRPRGDRGGLLPRSKTAGPRWFYEFQAERDGMSEAAGWKEGCNPKLERLGNTNERQPLLHRVGSPEMATALGSLNKVRIGRRSFRANVTTTPTAPTTGTFHTTAAKADAGASNKINAAKTSFGK